MRSWHRREGYPAGRGGDGGGPGVVGFRTWQTGGTIQKAKTYVRYRRRSRMGSWSTARVGTMPVEGTGMGGFKVLPPPPFSQAQVP